MTGRQRNRTTARYRRRNGQPAPDTSAPVYFSRERFRLSCVRRRGDVKLPTITLDPLVSSFSWERLGAIRTGDMTLNDPARRTVPGLIQKGDVVRCEVQARPGGAWSELWEMAVATPSHSISARTRSLRLRSRLAPAQQSRKHWKFRKDKAHPQGWTADAITHTGAEKFDVPLGDVARGKHRIVKLIDKASSFLEIVTEAWKREREWTGRRFDIDASAGKVTVRELRRPRYMLRLGAALLDAVMDETMPARFASAVVVTSTAKHHTSKKRRKIRAKVVDRARVRRYGYIVRHVDHPGLDTTAAARQFGKKWLARTARPFNRITLTHPGIPWVDRGNAVRLVLPEEAMTATVYVVSARHHVDYGAYLMELVVGMNDPWTADERAARVRQRKAAAKRKRKRPGAKSSARPKPARNRKRS